MKEWTKYHLNWTLLFSFLAAYLLGWIVSLFVDPLSSGFLIFAGVLHIWCLVATGWVLRKKGRRMIHLLWVLFLSLVGAFVVMGLENRFE